MSVVLYNPSGQYYTSWSCDERSPTGCSADAVQYCDEWHVPVGQFQPNDARQTISFNVTVSNDVADTLTMGSPLLINLIPPGQSEVASFTTSDGVHSVFTELERPQFHARRSADLVCSLQVGRAAADQCADRGGFHLSTHLHAGTPDGHLPSAHRTDFGRVEQHATHCANGGLEPWTSIREL